MFPQNRFQSSAIASTLFATLMAFSLIFPAQAESLTLKGNSVTDCGKGRTAICTKYYSRKQTKSLHNQFESLEWKTMRAVDIPSWIKIMAGDDSIGEMVSATRSAALRDGCLQLAYRKNQRDIFEWGYTTHPSYCWDK